jgi:signal transduction histidine kinase
MKAKRLGNILFSSYVVSIFIGFILFSLALFWMLSAGLYKGIDKNLLSDGIWIKNFIRENRETGEDYIREELAEHFEPKGEEANIFVSSGSGDIVYQSAVIKKNDFLRRAFARAGNREQLSEIQTIEVEENDTQYRLLTQKLTLSEDKFYMLHLASSLGDLKTIQRQLIFWLLVVIPLIGIPFGLWARAFARRVSGPLTMMAAKTREITVQKLSQRMEIPPSYDELQKLAESFNDMIVRLDQSVAEIKRFTSDASHELRTPLSVLKSQIQLALEEKSTSAEISKMLRDEFAEVSYMEKIINNLLMLSRYDAANFKIEGGLVDLSDILIEQCEKIRGSASPKGISIALGTIEPVQVRGDKTYLTQMVFNLLDNAVKYNKDGGNISIELRIEVDIRQAIMTIQDTGIGIPEENLPHVFERFYRVDKSRSREVSGSGLGLSIVKLITDLHKGKIQIESTLNEGTIVTVRLPVAW